MVQHWHVTYNDIHNLLRSSTPKIAQSFNPDTLIAIGGGLVSLQCSFITYSHSLKEASSQLGSWYVRQIPSSD